jgi:hypothetical protein
LDDTESEDGWSCDEPTTVGRGNRHKLVTLPSAAPVQRLARLALRKLSMTSEEDDGTTTEEDSRRGSSRNESPGMAAMYSEYQLRERDPRAAIRQYLSMYAVANEQDKGEFIPEGIM